jgi:hypothetical protein
MFSIKKYDGTSCTVSEEIYELTEDRICLGEPVPDYSKGTRVRLISGIDGSHMPGYHGIRGFVTVCRVEATTAEFIGVKKKSLRLVK